MHFSSKTPLMHKIFKGPFFHASRDCLCDDLKMSHSPTHLAFITTFFGQHLYVFHRLQCLFEYAFESKSNILRIGLNSKYIHSGTAERFNCFGGFCFYHAYIFGVKGQQRPTWQPRFHRSWYSFQWCHGINDRKYKNTNYLRYLNQQFVYS